MKSRNDLSFTLAAVEPYVLRVPVETPVRTAFGIMHSRPALLVRVVGADGVEGWGEVWCNFPSFGAEHRANAIRHALAPLVIDEPFQTPQHAFSQLSHRLRILALQAGEPGPLAQAVAGLDIAIWDMLGHRHGLSVQRLLSGTFRGRLPAYASGIGPEEPERVVTSAQSGGHRAFKLKLGFDDDLDLANLRRLRDLIGSQGVLMADANQAWPYEQALAMGRQMDDLALAWLEEPMPADTPQALWDQLSSQLATPLAGGENLRDEAAFGTAIEQNGLRVIQPDIGKWGGFSGCLPVARRAIEHGKRFCPHWLGGGVGLLASAHLLACAGGDGMVEVDINPNPLRDLIDRPPDIADGHLLLDEAPGLGATPRQDAITDVAQ